MSHTSEFEHKSRSYNLMQAKGVTPHQKRNTMIPEYVPTPAEIAETCRLIRAGWSHDEWIKRRVSMPREPDREYQPGVQ
ncbi:hypothetical protein [Schlesneria sp. T3-172]|uniref:hypothetical protein n=1 Tax=Schlesneria sphaerica TaxID=3373610 RepID=UPI0037C51192